MFKQRVLIQLSVRGDIRFVSHHDLMKVLGRSARRAGLSVAMSGGFNPRQKISLLLARGVGVASDAEFAEMDLDEWVGIDEFRERLNESLPEGLRVERVVLGHPGKRHRVVGIKYRVDCRSTLELTQRKVQALLEQSTLWVQRERRKANSPPRIKRVDIRPFISAVRVGECSVEMSLKVSDHGTTRPEEVWWCLGLDPQALLRDCTITRTAMELSPPV